MHIKFTKGISLSLIENLSSARKVWHICTVYCTWSNFILSRWYFMIKQKKRGLLVLFFQICMNWETKLKPKILDLNHCQGKIHLEVSVGNRIYKNRENVLWIIPLICMAVKHTFLVALEFCVFDFPLIDCLYRKTKEIFMKCNLIHLWNSYLWQCVWFEFDRVMLFIC